MHVIWTHRLVHVQSHQILQWWDFLPLTPTKKFKDVRDVESLSLLHVCWSHFSIFIYQRRYTLLGLSLLTNIPVKSLLVIFYIPCQFLFHLHLGFSDHISACLGSIPLFSPGYTSLLPLLVYILFLFSVSLVGRSLLSHAALLPHLPDFLFWEMESSCARCFFQEKHLCDTLSCSLVAMVLLLKN